MQKGKHKRIILETWNIRTILNRATTSRSERGTALVARELQCYRVDIAALSETRIADEGSLREGGGDYTLFWKGKLQAEDRIHGVGFVIRSALLRSMPVQPVGINERLMKLRIPLTRTTYHTFISAYTPTLTRPDDAKEQFYEQFDQFIRSIPSSDKLVIVGDSNARVGSDYSSWGGVLGRHGVGKINDNGLLLLSKCAEHSICITNTLFRMADKYKTTWMHPRSKHWHLIDFIIVRQRDIRDVRATRAMRGAEGWNDHRLVRAVLALHIAPLRGNRPKTVRAAYNVTRLKDPSYRARFQQVLDKLQDCVTAEGSTEKRNQGRPKVRYKDTVKSNIQCCHINPRDLQRYAMVRPKWRDSVHRAAANFEEARCQKLTAARKRHHRAASAVIITTDFQCPYCSRLCASGLRLGLGGHLCVHRWVVEYKRHHRILWTTTSR